MTIQGNIGINKAYSVSSPFLTSAQVRNVGLSNDVFKLNDKNIQPTKSKVSCPVNNLYIPRFILGSYLNEKTINELISANPKLQSLISDYGLEGEIHPENVKSILNTHLTTTNAIALQIANKMGLSVLDKKLLEEACFFHDFGKVLIPKEIIEKPAELTDEERNIINLHAELGAELLSTTGMNKRVLNAIKDHHMPNEANNDILGQILSVADIYSALREQRSYKKPLTIKQSLDILDQKAQNGEVSTEVVDTLKSIVVSSNVA